MFYIVSDAKEMMYIDETHVNRADVVHDLENQKRPAGAMDLSSCSAISYEVLSSN